MNRKTILKSFFVLFLLSGTIKGTAQVDTLQHPGKKEMRYQPYVIKTSPTALLWGGVFPFTSELRIMAEITSGRTQSEQLSISLITRGIFLSVIEQSLSVPVRSTKVNGYRVQYAHKFYLIRKKKFAPYGFYLAPLVSYMNAHIALANNRGYYLDFRHFNINAVAGIQVGKFHRVTLDVYTGFGYKNNKAYEHYASNKLVPYNTSDFGELYTTPLNFVFGINLGYSL